MPAIALSATAWSCSRVVAWVRPRSSVRRARVKGVRQSWAISLATPGGAPRTPPVDVLDPLLGAYAQPGTCQQAKTKARQQTEPERLTDDVGHLLCLIIISSE